MIQIENISTGSYRLFFKEINLIVFRFPIRLQSGTVDSDTLYVPKSSLTYTQYEIYDLTFFEGKLHNSYPEIYSIVGLST